MSGMDWWLTGLLVGGTALTALSLWARQVEGDDAWPQDDRDRSIEDMEAADREDAAGHWSREPEPWEAEAVARWGTETTVRQFIDEGRTDELRGLGYTGDLTDN